MIHLHRKSSAPSFIEAEINLTPLVDVLFVILLQVVLLLPLVQGDKIDLALSKKELNPLTTQPSLTIFVNKEDGILFQDQKIDLPSLEAKLRDIHQKEPTLIPQLVQDRASSFGRYQEVKELLETVGFSAVELLLTEDHNPTK